MNILDAPQEASIFTVGTPERTREVTKAAFSASGCG